MVLMRLNQQKTKMTLKCGYKKANVGLDAIMILIVLFVFAGATVIGFKVMTDINTDIQADSEMSITGKATMQQVTTQYPAYMDNGFLLMLVLFWILAIVSSFFIDAHPIFFALFIIILLVILFIGASISNIYEEIIDDDNFSASAASFPKTNWIFNHLVILVLSISATIGIALYGKTKLG